CTVTRGELIVDVLPGSRPVAGRRIAVPGRSGRCPFQPVAEGRLLLARRDGRGGGRGRDERNGFERAAAKIHRAARPEPPYCREVMLSGDWLQGPGRPRRQLPPSTQARNSSASSTGLPQAAAFLALRDW